MHNNGTARRKGGTPVEEPSSDVRAYAGAAEDRHRTSAGRAAGDVSGVGTCAACKYDKRIRQAVWVSSSGTKKVRHNWMHLNGFVGLWLILHFCSVQLDILLTPRASSQTSHTVLIAVLERKTQVLRTMWCWDTHFSSTLADMNIETSVLKMRYNNKRIKTVLYWSSHLK